MASILNQSSKQIQLYKSHAYRNMLIIHEKLIIIREIKNELNSFSDQITIKTIV